MSCASTHHYLSSSVRQAHASIHDAQALPSIVIQSSCTTASRHPENANVDPVDRTRESSLALEVQRYTAFRKIQIATTIKSEPMSLFRSGTAEKGQFWPLCCWPKLARASKDSQFWKTFSSNSVLSWLTLNLLKCLLTSPYAAGCRLNAGRHQGVLFTLRSA